MWHMIRVEQRSVVAMRALGDAPVEACTYRHTASHRAWPLRFGHGDLLASGGLDPNSSATTVGSRPMSSYAEDYALGYH